MGLTAHAKFNASNSCNSRKLYIKGTASDNFNVEIANVCRICAEFTRKWHAEIASYMRIIFHFLVQNSDNPSYATVVPAVHMFSHTYPTPCVPLAGL